MKKTFLNNAPIRRIAIVMKTTAAFTESSTENPFSCQHFDLRHLGKLKGCQPIVDFDAADNCLIRYDNENNGLSRW